MTVSCETALSIESNPQTNRWNFEKLFFLLALGFNLFITINWIRQPLVDFHSFRQTQTAVSAYWIQEDGQWLNLPKYETPLFGSPWRVPFEFPIYQLFVAAVYHVTHISMDALGRGISALFFYACLWPLYIIVDGFGLNRRLFFLTAALLVLSPMYLYWSRTFMIESTAVFFCFLFLAAVQKCLSVQRWAVLWWVLLTVSGLAGILIKVTTFPTFALAGACLVLRDMMRGKQWKSGRRWVRCYIPIAFSVGLILVAVEAWVKYSDAIKLTNPISAILTSTNLRPWEWGTGPQRISRALWIDTIWNRVIPHTIGTSFILALVLIGFITGRWRAKGAIVILLALFLADFLLFTNLHIVHDYYACSTSLFLIFAMAMAYWALRIRYVRFYYIACAVTAGMEIYTFCTMYGPFLHLQPTKDAEIAIAYFVDSATPRDSVILIIGSDWNSLMAYYSQRRAIYFAGWTQPETIIDIFTHPEHFADGHPVSAIIQNTLAYQFPEYINPLMLKSRVAHFGVYRVILLPMTPAQQDNHSGVKRLVLNKPLDRHMQGFVKRARQRISGLGHD